MTPNDDDDDYHHPWRACVCMSARLDLFSLLVKYSPSRLM